MSLIGSCLRKGQESIPRAYEKEGLSKPLPIRIIGKTTWKEVNNGKTYDSIIRRNGGEAKERAVSASVSSKVEKAIKDCHREHGQADPFPARYPASSVAIPRRLDRRFSFKN
jgi:hypothetical protein